MQHALKMSFGITKRAFTIAVVVATIAWSVAATFAIAPRMASAAVSSGDLVKGSLSAVYYIGSDGKRYVFTNDKAYFSWYTDFSTVKKISDTELAAITIGGNVTYRPGVKMVKIQSDPKVYAVAHGGVLRWVATEAAAVALYGATWNKKIDDIGDAFFVNYTVGSQINSASDYVLATEQSSSTTINADKGLAGAGAINITLASDNPAGGTLTYTAAGVNLLKVNFAGTGTITGLTFKRVGAGASADWGNVYLYDGDVRLTSGRSVTSTANEVSFSNLNVAVSGSKVLTLVGDLLSTNTNTVAGDSHAFELEAATKVLSTVTVGGTFPIVGNNFVLSGSASGGITAAAGSTVSNPKVGQLAVELANFKLTGGTAEDVSVRRIVINNSGSAQLSNLPNMMIQTGGTTVASNPIISGSAMTFVLAVPYTLGKGTSRNFSIVADIAGTNRPNVDTIHLYIDQTYDVYATGATYGLGVAVTNNYTSALANAGTALMIEGGQITYAQNGPATGDVSVGGDDIRLLKWAVTSANRVEVRNTAVRITCAVVAACLDDGDLPVTSNWITDLKIKNADTGVVLAGPVDVGSWVDGGADIRTKSYTDRYEIAAGQTLNLVLTADVSAAATAMATATLTAQLDARVLTDIRNLDSNLDVPLTDIVPSSALAGNPQTIRASGLTVGLASSPTSATVTKGSTVNALGVNFTAGSASDVKVTQIRLRGYIDENASGVFASDGASGGETHAVADIIQSVTIWDGSTQLGTTKSPDSNGDLNFTSLSWTVPAGTTKTLTAKAVVSNNVPYSLASDTFLLDLVGDGVTVAGKTLNVTAQDKDSNTVYGTSAGWSNVDYHLQLGSTVTAAVTITTTTAVIISAAASGTLQIQIDGDTPSAALVTANTNDNSLTRIKFTSINEAFQVTRLTVENRTAAASRSITSVRLFDKNGTLFCSGALDSNNRLRCANDAGLFTVANDQVITIKVNIDQEGSGTTGANSGDEPIMSIYANATDATYADDIKVVGVSSGTALQDANMLVNGDTGFTAGTFKMFTTTATYVADSYGTGTSVYVAGNTFVIRKTQPTVATVATSTTLINGEMTVYKFSVTAASNADVALKQLNLTMSRSGVALGSYRIFENGTALDTALYTILSSGITGVTDPLDLKAASALAETNNGGTVNILFKSERTVAAGTTKTYDVKATISAAASGDSLTHVLSDDASSFGTGDAGFAMNLGTNFCILDATNAIFNLDGDACLLDAGESEMTIPSNAGATLNIYATRVAAGQSGYITGGVLMTSAAEVYIELGTNGTYDAATDIRLMASVVANAHTTVDYTLVDDLTNLFFDVNYNGAYNVGTDIVLVDAQNLAAAGLVNTLGSNFVWSDTSGDAHSITTKDWTNGFHVKTLPTSAQSLSL